MTHAEAATRLRRTVEHTVGKKARIILERSVAVALLTLEAVAATPEGKQLQKELGRRVSERFTINKEIANALLQAGPDAAEAIVEAELAAKPTPASAGKKTTGKAKASVGDKTPPQGAGTLDEGSSPAAADVL